MSSRVVLSLVTATFALAVTACGGSAPSTSESQPPAPAASTTDASHEGHSAGGRVYFVQPKDGATIKPLTTLEFGSDQLTIAAVPQGEVKEVRAGTGHYHLGIDTDCLPAGTVIPKADPWIHFGTGKSTIDQSFTPGRHKLSLQAGDDQHRTIDGLCETITVNVAE